MATVLSLYTVPYKKKPYDAKIKLKEKKKKTQNENSIFLDASWKENTPGRFLEGSV